MSAGEEAAVTAATYCLVVGFFFLLCLKVMMGFIERRIEQVLRRMANEGSIRITTREIVRDPGPPLVECAACGGTGRVTTSELQFRVERMASDDYDRTMKTLQGICLGCDGAGRRILR